MDEQTLTGEKGGKVTNGQVTELVNLANTPNPLTALRARQRLTELAENPCELEADVSREFLNHVVSLWRK